MPSDSQFGEQGRISLLLSDVDGTLVNGRKELTPATIDAVHALAAAGIAFALTSARPPAGLASVVAALRVATPIAGFNGGMIVDQSGSTIRKLDLTAAAAARTIEVLEAHGVDIWVFRGNDWLITDPKGEYVPKEQNTIGYGPIIVDDFSAHLDDVTKIVGSSSRPDVLIAAGGILRNDLGNQAAVSLSQPYYLDITHEKANKGGAVQALSEILLIPVSEIATIGDGQNDIRMFEVSGYSIAMGNASAEVRSKAKVVTGTNESTGFADAVDTFILPRAPKPTAR